MKIFLPKIMLFLLLSVSFYSLRSTAQSTPPFRVVGYYCGTTIPIDSFEVEKLTHLIFCFGGLRGKQLSIHSADDSATIKRMVRLKSRNPQMKVMLSLGGWGGCKDCSDVFSTEEGRREFAHSVRDVTKYFHADGLDLDWEYPAIKGFPGHNFSAADRDNFTELLREIRKENKSPFEISFAAGGFTAYIDSSVDWQAIIPYVNFINIMSYDLVHGYSTVSGHHTPLYSTKQQTESTDHAVQMLLQKGVPADKLVIGAAFYGRMFKIAEGNPVDLYMPAAFSHGFSSKSAKDTISEKNGFVTYWDDVARAPYAINVQRRLVATYDDERSVAAKTKYAREQKLGGIMFWQLYDDKFHKGLLQTIFENQ